ncbi:MAG: DUF6531 domain-containing protein, partial [Planctomycetota bacterium]|nr:DUF6531 domain-containing protein [Planctomycetota bacterium]
MSSHASLSFGYILGVSVRRAWQAAKRCGRRVRERLAGDFGRAVRLGVFAALAVALVAVQPRPETLPAETGHFPVHEYTLQWTPQVAVHMSPSGSQVSVAALPTDIAVAAWLDLDLTTAKPQIVFSTTRWADRTSTGWSSPEVAVGPSSVAPPDDTPRSPILVREGDSLAAVWVVERKKPYFSRSEVHTGAPGGGSYTNTYVTEIVSTIPADDPDGWTTHYFLYPRLYKALYQPTSNSWSSAQLIFDPPQHTYLETQTMSQTLQLNPATNEYVLVAETHGINSSLDNANRPCVGIIVRRDNCGRLRYSYMARNVTRKRTRVWQTTPPDPDGAPLESITTSETISEQLAIRDTVSIPDQQDMTIQSNLTLSAAQTCTDGQSTGSAQFSRSDNYGSPLPASREWIRTNDGWFLQNALPNGLAIPTDAPLGLEPVLWMDYTGLSDVAMSLSDLENNVHLAWPHGVTSPCVFADTVYWSSAAGSAASLVQASDLAASSPALWLTENGAMRLKYMAPAEPLPATPNQPQTVTRFFDKTAGGWQVCPEASPSTVKHRALENLNGETYLLGCETGVRKMAPGAPWDHFTGGAMVGLETTYLSESGTFYDSMGSYSTHTYQPNLGDQDPYCMFDVGPNASVNVSNGNLFFSLPLFSSNGKGISTSCSLFHNSLDPEPGVIGPGWTHSYHMYLTASGAFATVDGQGVPTGGILSLADGRKIVFNPYIVTVNGVGATIPEIRARYYARIEARQAAGGWRYVLVSKYGMEYFFSVETGKLDKIRDTNGNELVLFYQDGLLSSVQDSAGRTTTFAYDPQERIVSITDASGAAPPHSISFLYEQEKLRTVTFDATGGLTPDDPMPYAWKFLYHPLPDGDGTPLGAVPSMPQNHPEPALFEPLLTAQLPRLLAAIATPRGLQGRVGDTASGPSYGTRFFYGLDRRCAISFDPYEQTRWLKYIDVPTEVPQPYLNVIKMCKAEFYDRANVKKTVAFDPATGLAGEVVDVFGAISRKFDIYYNVIEFTDKNDTTTRYAYTVSDFTHLGFPMPPAEPPWNTLLGPQTPHYVQNNLLGVMEPGVDETELGPVSYYLYTTDGFNRVARMRDSENIETAYEYDSRGNLSEIQYPHFGTGIPDPSITQGYLYDNAGRIMASKDPRNMWTTYVHDEEGDSGTGLVTSILAPGTSQPERFEYDRMGNMTKRKPRVAAATSYELDALSRVKRVIAPSNRVTEYSYDEDSNTMVENPPQGASTTHKYDKLGRLLEAKTGILKTEHQYDVNGNVTWSKSNSTISTFEYDSLGRTTRTQRTGAGHTNYFYNADSSIRRKERWGTHIEITECEYNSRGKLVSTVRDSTPGDVQTRYEEYRYTAGGRLEESWVEVAGDDFVSGNRYVYDKRGRMTASRRLLVKNGEGTDCRTTSFSYDNTGNRVGMTDPNGFNRYFEYDSRNRLICTRDHNQNITAAFEYNDDGQRT